MVCRSAGCRGANGCSFELFAQGNQKVHIGLHIHSVLFVNVNTRVAMLHNVVIQSIHKSSWVTSGHKLLRREEEGGGR